MYMTADGKALKEQYQWEARTQFHGEPLSEPLCVTVRLFYGTKRKADWDNAHKLWQDALTGIVWLDDSQIVEAHVFKRYDKERPRIEIELELDLVE